MGEMVCVCWDREGVLCRMRGVVWCSWKPAGAEFVFPVVNALCGAALGLFIWSEFPSKKLKEGGKGPKIALSRLNFASFGPIK